MKNNVIDGTATDLQPKQEEVNAVVIQRIVKDDGTVTVMPSVYGNVVATEVQTIIEMGLVEWRKHLGL